MIQFRQEKEVTREEQQRFIDIAMKVLQEADLPVDDAPESDDEDEEETDPIEFREKTDQRPPMVLAFLYNYDIAIKVEFHPNYMHFSVEMGDEYVDRDTTYGIDMTHRMQFLVAIVKQMMYVQDLAEQFSRTDDIPRGLKIKDLLKD